jgi:hypothetical protein
MILAMLSVFTFTGWMIPNEAYAQPSASYQVFYDGLSPYGNWVNYPNYGYVWMPDVAPGFVPYATAGHWVYTDDGWTWVSDYPWGWAPFHYGRWNYDNNYGWFWIPDNEWGPAWVSWRRSPGYYGWAPLGPGISISVSFGRGYNESNDRWTFVNDRDITRSDIGNRYIDRSRNVTIINNSTVIVNQQRDNRRNSTYIAGPDRNDVQKATHTTVKSVPIRENASPGQHVSNGALQIYRPQMQKVSGNGRNPAPSKVMKLTDVKTIAQRNPGSTQKNTSSANTGGKQQQNVNAPNNKTKPEQNVNSTAAKNMQAQKASAQSNGNKQPLNAAPTQNRNAQVQKSSPAQNRSTQAQKSAQTQNRNTQPQRSAPTQNRSAQPQRSALAQNKSAQPQRSAPAQNKSAQPQRSAPAQNKSAQPQRSATSANKPPARKEQKPDEKR